MFPGLSTGEDLFRSRVYLRRDGAPEKSVTHGYAPLLSPDGRRLAFLRRSRQASHELWLIDLETGREQRLTDALALIGFNPIPLDRIPALLSWHGGVLYAGIIGPPGHITLAKFEGPGWKVAPVPLSGEWTRLTDARISPSGLLAGLVGGNSNGSRQVLVHDLERKITHPLYSDSGAGTLYLAGWLGRKTLVAARSFVSNSRKVFEVLVLAVDSSKRQMPYQGEGYGGTVRLNGQTIVFIGSPGGIHNLYELDLGTAETRKLTDNQVAGVTFSAPAVTSQGTILYSYHVSNVDVKLLRLSDDDTVP